MIFSQYPYVNFSDLNMDWLLKTVKSYTVLVEQLNEWKVQHEAEYEELKAFQDAIIRGDFPLSIQTAFIEWMVKNSAGIIGSLIKSVYFGLTDSGYFVAYIPDSWEDITFFTTEYDIEIPYFDEYGHLVLAY